MVILDKHAVGEIEPVVLPAAAAHGVLVDHAQPGRGLARIEDARLRARDCFHELASQGRNPAHALQKIKNHALAGKNHPRIMADHRDGLSLVQPNAIENLRMRSDFIVRRDSPIERGVHIENARHAADPGQNAILLGDDRRRRSLVRVNAGVAGGIPRRPVFEQRILQNRRQPS